MSKAESFERIIALIRDGHDDDARAVFESIVADERHDAYQDGFDDGEEEARPRAMNPDLEEAVVQMRRGERTEALVWLERFMGSSFIGSLVRP